MARRGQRGTAGTHGGSAGTHLGVWVNNRFIANVAVPQAGSFSNFQFTSPLAVQLQAGLNSLRIQALNNWADEFKTLRLALQTPAPPATPTGVTATVDNAQVSLDRYHGDFAYRRRA